MELNDSLRDRLIRMESALMHLERDVEQLHQVIVAQEQEIGGLRRTLERLEAALLGEDRGQTPEVRDPAAEIPPHY